LRISYLNFADGSPSQEYFLERWGCNEVSTTAARLRMRSFYWKRWVCNGKAGENRTLPKPLVASFYILRSFYILQLDEFGMLNYDKNWIAMTSYIRAE
jgi:hypothetical protein